MLPSRSAILAQVSSRQRWREVHDRYMTVLRIHTWFAIGLSPTTGGQGVRFAHGLRAMSRTWVRKSLSGLKLAIVNLSVSSVGLREAGSIRNAIEGSLDYLLSALLAALFAGLDSVVVLASATQRGHDSWVFGVGLHQADVNGGDERQRRDQAFGPGKYFGAGRCASGPGCQDRSLDGRQLLGCDLAREPVIERLVGVLIAPLDQPPERQLLVQRVLHLMAQRRQRVCLATIECIGSENDDDARQPTLAFGGQVGVVIRAAGVEVPRLARRRIWKTRA